LVIPGKLFLIGEYGVIEGGLAMTCATRPGFQVSTSVEVTIHPESPAGIFLREVHPHEPKLELPGFLDGVLGPGFGTSTAELILAFIKTQGKDPDLFSLWGWFKERFPKMSGADLATQISAKNSGEAVFAIGPGMKIQPQSRKGRILQNIQVFKTPSDQKLKTHEDLAKMRSPVDLPHLNQIAQNFLQALQEDDLAGASFLSEFAEALSNMGRESPYSCEVRKRLTSVTGVLGAKGCGAALHDVFVVACDHRRDSNPALFEVAKDLGLISLGPLGELLW